MKILKITQKILILISLTSEGRKAVSNLEPPGGFEPGTPELEIQHLNHYVIAPLSMLLCYLCISITYVMLPVRR